MRPLLNKTIDELEDIFLHANDIEEYQVLYNELKNRKKLRALQLLERVINILNEHGYKIDIPIRKQQKNNIIPIVFECKTVDVSEDVKSFASEFAVSCGIAGIPFDFKNIKKHIPDLQDVFIEKCMNHKDETFVKCSYQAGEKVREKYMQNISQISLTRTERAQYTDISSKDLVLHLGTIGRTNVSVKYASDVIWNGAPERFFVDILQGHKPKKYYAMDWFDSIAPQAYNELFIKFGGIDFFNVKSPNQIRKQVARDKKKQFAQQCKKMLDEDLGMQEAYQSFCKNISSGTAAIFNFNLRNARDNTYLLNNILWDYFRIDNTRHIICGMGHEQLPLAILVYTRSEWAQRWDTLSIEAKPRLNKNQPEIIIQFTIADKETQEIIHFDMFAEIRWTHGKFVSLPECKIKKNFRYGSLPWCEVL